MAKNLVLEFPVKNPIISQEFGFDNTIHPLRKEFYAPFNNKHPGVDFRLPINSDIYSSYPGIVVRKEFHKGMGNVVGTRNGNIVILYAHLSKILVNLGQILKTDESIGLSGDTGTACNEPHLHFEIRDITKVNLKEMVFDPPFGKIIKQFKDSFTYQVNNTNTPKSLQFLSIRYFGNESYWHKIAKVNNLKINSTKVISNNTEVIIPNF